MAGKPPATLGRGDLLRALHAAAGADAMPAAAGLVQALGYAPAAAREQAPRQRGGGRQRKRDDLPPLPPGPRQPPLRVPMLGAAWVPAPEAEPANPPPAHARPAPQPLTAADWLGEPGSTHRPPPPSTLLPAARVVPAALHALQWSRPAGLDLPALLAQVARRELPARLPRAARVSAAPLRILVLDAQAGLQGYTGDMVALARQLARPLGGAGWQVRWLAAPGNPLAGYTDHTPRRTPRHGATPPGGVRLLPVQPWQALPPDARVLLLSDLGLAGAAAEATASATTTAPAASRRPGLPALPRPWQRWLALVQAQGARVQVWSPVPLRADAPATLPVLHWSTAGPRRPQPLPRGAQHHSATRQAVAQVLLAVLAFCPWIDVALLRALRLAIGPGLAPDLARQALDAGIEQLVWQSPDLTRGWPSRRMRPEALGGHRAAFGHLLSPAQQWVAHQVVVAHYSRFSRPLVHMHSHSLAGRAAPALLQRPGLQQRLQAADGFVARLTDVQGHTGVSALETRLFLHSWLHHGDAHEQQQQGQRAGLLLQALARWEQQAPRALALPPGLPHADLADTLAPDAPLRQRWLLHDARQGQLLLSEAPAAPGQSALWPQPLQLATADVQPGGGQPRQWLDVQAPSLPLVRHVAELPAVLRSRQGDLWIGPLRRPTGVLGWHRGADGLHLVTQPCGSLQLQVPPEAVQVLPPVDGDAAGHLRLQVPPLPVGDRRARMGIHPEHGLYLDLDLAGVVQRFVWIEPTGPQGFVMGSPEWEAGRHFDEGPRHRVTLSQGFWLADTPCTQALWLAVMGGQNPSHFRKGDDAPLRPVEQVSWDDVQGFLQRAGSALGSLGVQPVLPTEAQWEYACRAGTLTAYAWGDTMEPGRANVGSDGTTVVKRYAPNGWGLYDMHGNVWEWCADGMRDYDGQPQVDPEGPVKRDSRVVRGGAWDDPAAWARSAFRNHWRHGWRLRDQGFRLALRSPGPGGQPVGPGGPVLGRGAPPGVVARPEGAPRGGQGR